MLKPLWMCKSQTVSISCGLLNMEPYLTHDVMDPLYQCPSANSDSNHHIARLRDITSGASISYCWRFFFADIWGCLLMKFGARYRLSCQTCASREF